MVWANPVGASEGGCVFVLSRVLYLASIDTENEKFPGRGKRKKEKAKAPTLVIKRLGQ